MENETDCCMQLAIKGEKHMNNKSWDEAALCLEAALKKQSDDPCLTDLICAKLWASHFQMGNYDKSLEYVHRQLQIPTLVEDFEREARCVVKIGLTLSLLNRYEEASNKFEYLLETAKSKSHDDFTGIAMYYLAQTNFKLAAELEARELEEEQPTVVSSLVQTHLWQAISYFQKYKALIIKDDQRGSPLEAKICGSLAHVYFKLNQLQDALDSQIKCLQISRQFGDVEIQFSSISFLGTIHCCMHNYEEAAKAFEQSFFMAEQLNDDQRKAKALYRLANAMSMLGDHTYAIQVAHQYLHLVKLNQDEVGESNVYCFLCDQFRLLGDLEESLNYALKYKHLTEKLEDWTGYELAVEVCEEISVAIKQEKETCKMTSPKGEENMTPSQHCCLHRDSDRNKKMARARSECDEEGLVGSPLTSSSSSLPGSHRLPVSESCQSLSLSLSESGGADGQYSNQSDGIKTSTLHSPEEGPQRSVKSCRSCFNLSYGLATTSNSSRDSCCSHSWRQNSESEEKAKEAQSSSLLPLSTGVRRTGAACTVMMTDLDQLSDDDDDVTKLQSTKNLPPVSGHEDESASNGKNRKEKKNVLGSSKRWHSNGNVSSACYIAPSSLLPPVAFKATVSPASKCGGPASSHHKSKQGVKAAAKTSKQPPKVAAHIKRAYNTSITFLRNREVKRLSRCGSEFEFDPSLISSKKSRVAASTSSATASRLKTADSVSRCRRAAAGIKDTESLMEFITKAHSAGRIDDQQVSVERLHAHHRNKSKSNVFRTKSDGPVHMPRPEALCVKSSGCGAAGVTHSSSSSDSGCYQGAASSSHRTQHHSHGRDTTPAEKLIDQIVRSQSYRMNDQRSEGRNLPQSNSSDYAGSTMGSNGGGGGSSSQGHMNGRTWSQSHEQSFLDLLERCQDSRFDDQRTVLRPLLNSSPSLSDTQFLDSIQRGQSSGRMEEQRTTLPPPLRHTVSCNSANAAAAASTAGSYSFVANQEPEQQHTWASFLMQSSTSTTGSLPPANTTASSSGVSTGSSGLDTTGHSSHSINSLTASSSTQGRMEEQRTTLPPPLRHTVSCNSANAAAAASTAGSYSFVANQEPEQQHTWASFLMQSSTSTTGSLPPANTTASSSGVSTGSSGLDTTGHSSHSINSLTASSSTQGTTTSLSPQPDANNSRNSSSNFSSSWTPSQHAMPAVASSSSHNQLFSSPSSSSHTEASRASSANNTNATAGASSGSTSLFQRFRRGSSRKLEAVLSSQSKHSSR